MIDLFVLCHCIKKSILLMVKTIVEQYRVVYSGAKVNNDDKPI